MIALEARPPEGPHAGPRQRRAEARLADFEKFAFGAGRQAARIALHDVGQRLVDRDAALGPARIGVEVVERPEAQDVRA